MDAMKNSELAWAVLVEPKRAFAALREQPKFWFPLIAVGLAYTAFFLWYYSAVDIAWLGDHIVGSDPRMKDVSAANRATAAGMLSKSFLLWGSLLTVVVATPVLRLIEAAWFFLAGRAVNTPFSFKHWMALACWTAWPYLLLVLVMAVPMLAHPNGQVAQESLNLLSLNELVFHTPLGHPWNTLLATLTLLHPWVWWLTVLGTRLWTGRSWLFCTVFALLPVVALYGVWALISLFSA
ncbi:YIP1 family protein [Ramlibacter sp.]|uniref:YIP1 family protein n=1 Tax=Ramlibacter sp. TaxID=1917967 RepID=UPI001844D2A7|nr:YIP1 family protein [Ramlibacter sp.]MBA2672215.1 YIP1 family protein [Ramlibacter sp.]